MKYENCEMSPQLDKFCNFERPKKQKQNNVQNQKTDQAQFIGIISDWGKMSACKYPVVGSNTLAL